MILQNSRPNETATPWSGDVRGEQIRSYYACTSVSQPEAILVTEVEGDHGMILTDLTFASSGSVLLKLKVLVEGERERVIGAWQLGHQTQLTICQHFQAGIPIPAGAALVAFVSSGTGHISSVTVSGYLY